METTETKAKTVTKTSAPVYSVEQLTEAYRTFETARSIVECALKLTGKETFTIEEARKIIGVFKTKR